MYYNETMQSQTKGFTVVELLIVIAIIGVLVSVVLPRLQTARDEGIETKIKTDLVAVGKRAAVEESSTLTYDIVCGQEASTRSPVIADMIADIQIFSGGLVACRSRVGGYAVSVPLNGTTHWCVDSDGLRIERATALGAVEYSCQ